jgi:hypothetical protein
MTLTKTDGRYYLMNAHTTIIFDSFVNNRNFSNSVALRSGNNVVAVLYFEAAKEFYKAWRAM